MPDEQRKPEMGLSRKLFLAIAFSLPAMVFAGFMVWNAWRDSRRPARAGRRPAAGDPGKMDPALRDKLEGELARARAQLKEVRKDLLQSVARLQMLRVQPPDEHPGVRGEIAGLENQVRGLRLNELQTRQTIAELEKKLKTDGCETTDEHR